MFVQLLYVIFIHLCSINLTSTWVFLSLHHPGPMHILSDKGLIFWVMIYFHKIFKWVMFNDFSYYSKYLCFLKLCIQSFAALQFDLFIIKYLCYRMHPPESGEEYCCSVNRCYFPPPLSTNMQPPWIIILSTPWTGLPEWGAGEARWTHIK